MCQLPYTVGAGDYWIRIADAAGVTLAKLLRANSATVGTPLYPGDDICLPEGATLPAPPTPTTAAPHHPAPVHVAPATVRPTPPRPPRPLRRPPSRSRPPASRAEVEAIIREIWPDDLEDRALEIAWRESGYRANAQNWCCYGLFQIHLERAQVVARRLRRHVAGAAARRPHQRPGRRTRCTNAPADGDPGAAERLVAFDGRRS